MKNTKWMALLLAGGVFAGSAMFSASAIADPANDTTKQVDKEHKKEKREKKKDMAAAKIGEPAPAFTLTDTDGKTHNLSDYKGKVVVLEWFNPECPFIVKHHEINKTFNTLASDYSKRNVVFLAVNSNAAGTQGNGKDLNAKAHKDFGMTYPILLDEAGETGRAYGARTTPHVFIIDAEGKLAYQGAVDDNRDPKTPGETNYVKKALDEVLAGETVTTPETKPYGCSVKYASK